MITPIYESFGSKDFKKIDLWKQDKGQNTCAVALLEDIQADKPAIAAGETFEVSRVSIEIAEQ